MTLLAISAAAATKKVKSMTVVYQTSIECKGCEKKIMENIAFEKGVKDLSTDLSSAQVSIVFSPDKTDTTKLGNAIRKLGFTAKAISLK